jgi:SAM-dependent methyltransferase
MMRKTESGQSAASAVQNREFFARDTYSRHAARLDGYRNIRRAITGELTGVERLLDVGNGGVFEYDTSVVGSIVAVDLFLEELPRSRFPANVTARTGDALALDEPPDHYDAVLHAFVYHHLVGERAGDVIENAARAIAEAERVIKPEGRLIVAESCVPAWFYRVERAAYRPLKALARTPLLGGHPATFQLTREMLLAVIADRFEIQRSYRVPLGGWITQFGRPWPTALTPVRAYIVIARKPSGSGHPG